MFAKIAIAAMSTAVAFAATAPAYAAPIDAAGATRSVTVHYDDLDLAAAAGRDMLDTRLRRAAAAVCGVPGEQLVNIMSTSQCRVAAVADARADLAIVFASNDRRGGSSIVVAR